MIILLDFTNAASRVAAFSVSPRRRGARGAVWFSAPADRSVMAALAAARKRKPFSGAPTCVIVAQNAPGATRDVSWSAIRSAIAAGNAFAFASGVPVATVLLAGGESDARIAELARAAAKGAKKGEWTRAAYDGEPTITKPKIPAK